MEAIKGCQIPTQSLIIPYRKTLGSEALSDYRATGREPMPWQEHIINDLMATKKAKWVHRKFGYSLPRRNGKNEIVAMRELYGIIRGEQILHTAHRTTASHMAWERLCILLDDSQIEYESLRANGRERIELPTGGRIEFRTRSAKGGIGEGFDLVVIDEAQEYTRDQLSALKYVVSGRDNPQTIYCGTPPTSYSIGTVFNDMRTKALAGKTVNTGWAEWSIEKEVDPRHKESWYLTNPTLGYHLTEADILDEIDDDAEGALDFNIQRLGIWVKYNQKSAISEAEWMEHKVDKLPELEGKLYVGIKYGHSGDNVAMSIAVRTTDDRIFVESIDCRPVRAGNAWIARFLESADIAKVVIDGANGQDILIKYLKKHAIKVKTIKPTVKDIILANALFEQSFYSHKIWHSGQASLTQVAGNCDKRAIGTSGGFGYRALNPEREIALLDSVILASWVCNEAPKKKKSQRISY